MRVALVTATVTVAAAAGTSYALVAVDTPDLAPTRGPEPRYQDCHPVDMTDVADDRRGMPPEAETLDDEGEFACVGDRRFAELRRTLGLGGKP